MRCARQAQEALGSKVFFAVSSGRGRPVEPSLILATERRELSRRRLFYESDNSTTKGQVFDAEKYVGTPKDKIVLGGHIGLFMGSRTLKDAWPRIAPWIAGC